MSAFDHSLAWYCVRSTVGYEFRAAEMLSRPLPQDLATIGDLEIYCPRIRRLMPVGGKRRPVLTPLFPGYFFARFSLSAGARYVSSRPGVIGLVRFGEQAVPVPDGVLEELRGMDFENAPVQQLPEYRFVPGQKLVIREGPFAGMEAEYVAALSDGQRAMLLLDYLQTRVNVVADYASLESAA